MIIIHNKNNDGNYFDSQFEIDSSYMISNLEKNSIQCLQKDSCTYEHNLRVKEYCILMLPYLDVDSSIFEHICLAAEYHDIGKIVIDDSILFKKSNLSTEEFNYIKRHTTYGFEILKQFLPYEVALGVKQHHERLDGSGYPDGLKEDEISFIAKIIAVADSYDAMTSERPYNKPLTPKEAMDELFSCSGLLFDKDCVNALNSVLKDYNLI